MRMHASISLEIWEEGMRSSILAAVAIAAGLAVAAPAANAVPTATPGQLGLPDGARNAPEKTVLVCDPWTCYWRPDYGGYDRSDPYWGWRRHYWWGWHRPWDRSWDRSWGWPRW
jgi:hypothetical protein